MIQLRGSKCDVQHRKCEESEVRKRLRKRKQEGTPKSNVRKSQTSSAFACHVCPIQSVSTTKTAASQWYIVSEFGLSLCDLPPRHISRFGITEWGGDFDASLFEHLPIRSCLAQVNIFRVPATCVLGLDAPSSPLIAHLFLSKRSYLVIAMDSAISSILALGIRLLASAKDSKSVDRTPGRSHRMSDSRVTVDRLQIRSQEIAEG